MVTKGRARQCREAARNLLSKYYVSHPDDIQLETIAWHNGQLRVKRGGLTGADGRIIASPSGGGVIRVANQDNEGRTRFTLAHEIGHFILHADQPIDRSDNSKTLMVWHDESEEAEANIFAAELLMPEFLFGPESRKTTPSIKHLEKLAVLFGTSLTATTFQYWEYTNEPLAVVISDGWEMKRFSPIRDKSAWIRFGQIHEHSAAGERLAGKAKDSRGMVDTPAYAWLEGFEEDNQHFVKEDSIYLEYYDRTISLVWIDEPLVEDDEY